MGIRIESVYSEELDEYVDMAVEDDNSFYFVGTVQNDAYDQTAIDVNDYEIIE